MDKQNMIVCGSFAYRLRTAAMDSKFGVILWCTIFLPLAVGALLGAVFHGLKHTDEGRLLRFEFDQNGVSHLIQMAGLLFLVAALRLRKWL